MTRTRMAMTLPSREARRSPDANVAALHPRETITFDPARLTEVCDAHGTGAESYIAVILDGVEAQIALAASRAGEPGALGRICREIVGLSQEIGMLTMEQAARAVLDCLATGDDHAARAACLQRLLRLGTSGGGGWEMTRGGDPDTVA